MSQYPLFPEEVIDRIICFNIQYEGNNPLLNNHEIDAGLLSKSLYGYNLFSKVLFSKVFNDNIQIIISTNKDGSFKVLGKIAWKTAKGLSTFGGVIGLLSWLGVFPEHAEEIPILIQKKIIELIVEGKGDTSLISGKIRNIEELSEEEKSKLLSVVGDNQLRKALDDMTQLLDVQGYKGIYVKDNYGNEYSIDKLTRPYFNFDPPDECIITEFSDTVEIIYLSPELTRWQFHGKKDFWADIEDEEFLRETKKMTFSQLKKKKFLVRGERTTVKKYGAKKGTDHWVITSIEEMKEQGMLPTANTRIPLVE